MPARLICSLRQWTGMAFAPTFEYATLARADVHTVGRVSAYPVVDYAAPALVVSRLTRSDGAGGTFRLSYAYEGAKVHALGRGFLGFARQSERTAAAAP